MIKTRTTSNEAQLESLKSTMKLLSTKTIADVIDTVDDMDELLRMANTMFVVAKTTIESLSDTVARVTHDLGSVSNDNARLSTALSEAQDALEELMAVEYDDALEHSTVDLMDAMCSSGAANITYSGEIEFDERLTLTKSDLKPFLREAITRWVAVKLSHV